MARINIVLFGHDISTRSTLIPLKESGKFNITLFCPKSKEKSFRYYALDKQNIPYFLYDDIKNPELIKTIDHCSPDYLIASGLCDKIPQEIINIPKKDALNIHPSLLPYYKGPNPWFWIIKNGDYHSGISIHKLTDHIDSGDLVYQLKFPISRHDTYGSLLFKSSYFIEQSLIAFIPLLEQHNYISIKQESGIYYTHPNNTELHINWNNSAQDIENLVKAGNPGLIIIGKLLGQPYQIIECSATTMPTTTETITVHDKRLYIPAKDYLVEIRILNAKTFGIISGYHFLNLAGLL